MEQSGRERDMKHDRAVKLLTAIFQGGNVTMVHVRGAPQNDQQWIEICLKWKPIRLVGALDRVYIHFPTTEIALAFGCEMEGKLFKGRPIQVAAILAKHPSDFDNLMKKMRKAANQRGHDFDYDITISSVKCCNCCGHAVSAHGSTFEQLETIPPPIEARRVTKSK